MTYHHRAQLRCVGFLVMLAALILGLWLLVGCQGGGLQLNPFRWFSPPTPETAARAPQDATQAQIAWTVAAPLGATAALLLVSGAIMFLLGAGLRAFQSVLFGVVLILVNGLMITVLKSRWTMFVLLGTAVLTGVLLYFDSRDGIWFWRQNLKKKNGQGSLETSAWPTPLVDPRAGSPGSSGPT